MMKENESDMSVSKVRVDRIVSRTVQSLQHSLVALFSYVSFDHDNVNNAVLFSGLTKNTHCC